ncbi:MAG: GTPase HflX [Lentisphaerae bacterium]|nr:GTPase HflX [Lentisphaerota bacterium]
MSTQVPAGPAGEKAVLVQLVHGRMSRKAAADSLAELERLAETAGATVCGSVSQRRQRPTPAFFVGEGKLAEIQLACRAADANLVVFDNDLSPVQVNSLDLALGVKVIDRTEVILQIFARRAQSKEAQIQVELAQLEYLVSRIPVSKTQQRFQGGIGMRGPGESPLQLRNQPMRRRIKDLKGKLETIQARHRRILMRRPRPFLCLVGYTNAGKSTLLNALTSAGAYVDDRLFATLDTKTRKVHLPDGRNAMITDTVGFIRHLPHGLVASFRSTLDVASEADLLLVVADASHPHVRDHLDVVQETLHDIGADGVPSVLVLNKTDLPAATEALPSLRAAFPGAIAVSARKGTGLELIKETAVKEIGNALPGGHPDRKSR